MTFSIIGGFIRDTAELASGAISTVHHATDATLDHIGLSAFIPDAVHEISDGALGLTQRGILDVGRTSGAILESLDRKQLHTHDKSIGGNLRDRGLYAPRPDDRRNGRDRGNTRYYDHNDRQHGEEREYRDERSYSRGGERSRGARAQCMICRMNGLACDGRSPCGKCYSADIMCSNSSESMNVNYRNCRDYEDGYSEEQYAYEGRWNERSTNARSNRYHGC